MLDFTSALYLGLNHPSHALRPWSRLSSGRPAVLGHSHAATWAAEKLAALMGCESAVLLPSTLHLFWDLFGALSEETVVIYLDKDAYAIARWGVERAAGRGTPLRRFRHHDPEFLHASVRRDAERGFRPVVVTDGFCPGCGRLAPLPDYLHIVRRYGGLLVLDDTQALGILGCSPKSEAPYGYQGGGSLQYFGINGDDIIIGSSLAKGFGVPVAILAGSASRMSWFKDRSETRVYCSPPSAAVIHAAEHALMINARSGEALRKALVRSVARFRAQLKTRGFATKGGLFPVQILDLGGKIDMAELYRILMSSGIRSVLIHGHRNAVIGFLFTVRHEAAQIDHSVQLLAAGIQGTCAPQSSKEIEYEQFSPV